MHETIAIVVLYNPSTDDFKKWQGYVKDMPEMFFCFIDNSDSKTFLIESGNAVSFANKKNIGIAAAQNIGIKYAQQKKFKYVLFFDQDSEIDSQYTGSILKEFLRVKSIEPKVVLLGPTIVNKDSSKKYKNNDIVNDHGYALVRALISSGSVADVSSFFKVGLMEESLFIDYVDFEWCWRAQHNGFRCARTQNVLLNHKVGQNLYTFFNYPIIVSAPIRYFYQYRNFIRLLKRDYVPQKWKRNAAIRKFFELIIVPFLAKNKVETFKFIIQGIKAGIKNEKP